MTPHVERRSTVVMIVLLLVTLGFFLPIWFLRRRAALNQLDSPKKIPRWPFLALIAVFALWFGLAVVAGPVPVEDVIGTEVTVSLSLIYWGLNVVLLWQCFRTKDILEDHEPPEDVSPSFYLRQARLSGLLTFFLHIFYLQHVINRDVVKPPQLA